MKKILFPAVLILTAACFSSCRKDMERPSWDTEILAPIVNASLNINNLLPDSLIQANADSSLKIVFSSDIYNLNVDSLFKIPDTTVHNSYNIPFNYTFNPSQTVINNNTAETTYELGDAELRTVIIKHGFVNYSVKSLIDEATSFVYKIPCATLGGVPFEINVEVPAATSSGPGIYNQTFDLSGYTFDLTGIAHNKVNTIYTSLTASISAAATSPVLVMNSDSLIIDNTFYDLVPYYAKGYFGQTTTTVGPETTDFDLFSRITDGTIQLEDVNFNLSLENSIGMDSRIHINNLSSINNRTGNTINLSNSLVGAPININRAAESGGVVYPTIANFPLTTSNSNIKPMIENLPDQFGYSLQLETNPLGNVSGSNDFIYSDRLFKARLNMEIPLSLVATNLTLGDTLNLTISNNEGEQDLKSGTFTLFADNGFPFDAQLQLYLLDGNGAISDSLFAYANTIDEAPLNSSLRAIGKKQTRIVVPVDAAKMTRLYNTERVYLKIRFNTAAQPSYIKIYSDYSIDVRLVGNIHYTVQLQ